MVKSRLRNRYRKYSSREDFLTNKKIKNKCNNLVKQSKKKYWRDTGNEGPATSNAFWNTIKFAITNKKIQTNGNKTNEEEKNEENRGQRVKWKSW